MTRGQKHRANGEGSIFTINTKQGTRYKAEKTIGYDVEGKRVVVSGTGATKALAIERRNHNYQKMLVLQGKAPASSLTSNAVTIRKLTLQDYLQTWLSSLNPEKIGAETRRAHAGKIANHINVHLGSTPLVLLTKSDIQKLFYEILPNKAYDPKRPEKRMTSGSIRNVWKPLYKALTEAVNDGLIQKNPMVGVDKPQDVMQEIEIHTGRPKELLMLLDKNLSQVKWLLVFALGIRQSELLGLTWDRLNLEPKKGKPPTLTIRQQLHRDLSSHGCGVRNGKDYPCGNRSAQHCPQIIRGKGLIIKKQTKTEAGTRVLPLPENLARLLREHKARHDILVKDKRLTFIEHDGEKVELTYKPIVGLENLVFTRNDGKPITVNDYQKQWKALCEKAGYDTTRQHINRHITATLLADADVSPEIAKLILGHSSERMTEYYRHLESTKAGIAPLQKIENLMFFNEPISEVVQAIEKEELSEDADT